ncbi:hypothetical protein QJS10_CPA10g00910 [Acorus calamus]|uniref:DUF547 domain-containing protein n=1 Tax=Acorus calamus TaxID=4465 RepID=A0AAV9DXR6_ACOCL|nr:hypothetical protein QJS10_CPA10g00910 [Acorus calamus]
MRLQQEKSIRIMLERAIGRTSSTLSPGHRHFATQTRELITEIESLEEEVANREQHVLSLYRSIFEQCTSETSSGRTSGIASPAHTKNGARKHPIIISSSFCSSKKFPMYPFRVLSSKKDSGKKNILLQSKMTGHASVLDGKTRTQLGLNCSFPMKVHENAPMMDKSNLGTLKDHLYQCPSKLSEDLVRCMAAIYCWLHCDALHCDASRNSETGCSPMTSRSSSGIVRPRHSNEDEPNNHNRSPLEISWISTRNQLPSYVIGTYRSLVEQLEEADPSVMESNAKLAFWINVYNSLLMHAHLVYGIPQGSLKRMALFHKLKVYTLHHIREELEKAKREFLQANVVVKKSKKVSLPKLLDAYSKEASISSDDLLDWVSENVDKKLHCTIQACIDSKSKRRASQLIEWLPYNTRFSYVLAKDLAKKP